MNAQAPFNGQEEWRPIPGHDGYEASSLGRVRSVDRYVEYAASTKARGYVRWTVGRVLKAHKKQCGGYFQVMLGRGVHMDVHVAVCLAFHGEKPVGCEVLHADHNPENNTPDNLRWGTRAENLIEDYRRGVKRRFAQKLSTEQVAHVRAIWPSLTAKGAKAALCRELGVSHGLLHNIISGKARKYG